MIKEFEGLDKEMLLKKAEQLKQTDGEGWAIGSLVERLCAGENDVLHGVRLSLPIILQLFKNAKTMTFDEYSNWVKSRMGYEA